MQQWQFIYPTPQNKTSLRIDYSDHYKLPFVMDSDYKSDYIKSKYGYTFISSSERGSVKKCLEIINTAAYHTKNDKRFLYNLTNQYTEKYPELFI